MNRRILLLSAFILFIINGFSQEIYFKPKWKANDVFKYYYFTNWYTPQDTLYRQDKDTITAVMTVLKADKTGFEVSLRYDYTRYTPPYPPFGLKKVIAEVKKTTPITLKLDTTGKYTGIKNFDQIKQACAAKIADLQKTASASDKEEFNRLKEKFTVQKNIEKYFAEDIEFFFMLYGSRFKRNSAFEYEDELKNPFGTTPIPATVSLETVTDANPALVEVKMFLAPDEARGAELLKSIRKSIQGREDDPGAIPDDQLLDLQDYYVYLHNTQTGAHHSAIYVRYLKQGSKESVESWKFILVP
jgi:hypothetical protein